MMDAVAFIFARGGSKGLPGKNIRPLGGKPLIAWSIEHAQLIPEIRRVIVSTDSEEIAKVAIDYGAEVPFIRPAELAKDNSSEWMAWRHALNYVMQDEGKLPDAMISLPATAPLRSIGDVEQCLIEFEKGLADAIITVSEAHRSPYFNMVSEGADGYAELVIPQQDVVTRRQDSPIVYDMATVAYIVKPEFVLNKQSLFEGKVKTVHISKERAVDIDTLFDFKIAEMLLNESKKDG